MEKNNRILTTRLNGFIYFCLLLLILSLFGNYFIRKDRANAEEKLPTITNNPPGNRFPVWSPDGKKIAFESSTLESVDNIYVMKADGSGRTQLTK